MRNTNNETRQLPPVREMERRQLGVHAAGGNAGMLLRLDLESPVAG